MTEADRTADAVLRGLFRDAEGWLSGEGVDNASRLDRTRVRIVDPLDGKREFVAVNPNSVLHRYVRGWAAKKAET
jgi:fructose-1,6-bisphosphatase/inositol monophosphatase family enzyme